MKTTLQILREARALIADPARWTQGVEAENAIGLGVNPLSRDACRFCAEGALRRAALFDGPETRSLYAYQTLWRVHQMGPHVINDKLGHAATLTMFDRAIAAEEARERA